MKKLKTKKEPFGNEEFLFNWEFYSPLFFPFNRKVEKIKTNKEQIKR